MDIFSGVKMIILCGAMCIAAVVTWQIQGLRLDAQKAKVERLQKELTEAVAANEVNMATISDLKRERDKMDTLCRDRLAMRNKLAEELRAIDKLQGQGNENRETDIGGGADLLLGRLNGMFPAENNSQN